MHVFTSPYIYIYMYMYTYKYIYIYVYVYRSLQVFLLATQGIGFGSIVVRCVVIAMRGDAMRCDDIVFLRGLPVVLCGVLTSQCGYIYTYNSTLIIFIYIYLHMYVNDFFSINSTIH